MVVCPKCKRPARDTGHGMGHCASCNEYFTSDAKTSLPNNTSYAEDLIGTLMFKESAVKGLSNNPKATKYGIFLLFFVGILTTFFSAYLSGFESGFGNMNFVSGFLLVSLFSGFYSFFVNFSIYHFISKIVFKGSASGVQFFRVMSAVFIIYFGIVAIPLPYTDLIASLWIFAQTIFIVKKLHGLSTFKSIVVAIIPLLVVVASTLYFYLWSYQTMSNLQHEASRQINETALSLGK